MSPTNRHPQPISHVVAAGAGEPFLMIEYEARRCPVASCEVAYSEDGRLASVSWMRRDGVAEVVDLVGAVDEPALAAAVCAADGLLVVQVAELTGVNGVEAQGESFAVYSAAEDVSRPLAPGRCSP